MLIGMYFYFETCFMTHRGYPDGGTLPGSQQRFKSNLESLVKLSKRQAAVDEFTWTITVVFLANKQSLEAQVGVWNAAGREGLQSFGSGFSNTSSLTAQRQSLTDWFTDWLTHWLTHSLIDFWLTDSLIGPGLTVTTRWCNCTQL